MKKSANIYIIHSIFNCFTDLYYRTRNLISSKTKFLYLKDPFKGLKFYRTIIVKPGLKIKWNMDKIIMCILNQIFMLHS